MLLAVILNILGRVWEGFSDFYVKHIFPLWVETYGRITGIFPGWRWRWCCCLGWAEWFTAF